MKKQLLQVAAAYLLLSTLNSPLTTAHAQGTAFTYQGRLNLGTNAANGIYDLRFGLWDALPGGTGNQQGNLLTNSATAVTNGLFTVQLDFGNQFPGALRWLEIGVRSNGVATFSLLAPRQPLTPAPYAITAGNVVSGGLASGTYGSAVTLNNVANSFNGNYTGNGGGLTNVSAATLGGLTSSNFWLLVGNNVAPGQFLGSTNNQPLELWVNKRRVAQLAYASNSASAYSPNVVFGHSANFVSNNIVGATISGGGSTNNLTNPEGNEVWADFGTVVGGDGNIAAGNYSVAGGNQCRAIGFGSTALGSASASGYLSTALGGANTSGDLATASGYSSAGADYATAMGYSQANGTNSTALGFSTAYGSYSFAAGRRAIANSDGDFVWADSQIGDFNSTGTNQFCIRSQGGIWLDNSTPAINFGNQTRQMLNLYQGVYGIGVQNYTEYFRSGSDFCWFKGGLHSDTEDDPGSGGSRLMLLNSGGLTVNGTFVSSSDRNLKAGFTPVDAKAVLEKVAALPITRWHYLNDTNTPHLVPVAQDFYAAFTVGPDDKHITTVDEGGVALAAIQGLNEKLEEQKAENAELKARLEKLERLISEKK
jgi:hypothetical protein